MPRNMSFALTTEQFRNRTKTVTRRKGWRFLKPGDIVNGCVKCMGLKPGEKIERLGRIRILSVRREPLTSLEEPLGYNEVTTHGDREASAEGFPGMTGIEFVTLFCREMKAT